ncbi:MAG TPA: zinc-binding dehydrogenase [Thermoanaerobaculia bacterium]
MSIPPSVSCPATSPTARSHARAIRWPDAGATGPQWRDLLQFTDEHRIRPVISHELAFEEIAEGHRVLEEKRKVGKVGVHV